jgi:PKD repeat protein
MFARERRVSAVMAAVLFALLISAMASGPARAATGDIGYVDQSYVGAVNPPTSDKPQSKLWYNDGSWWADMFDAISGTWHIFQLDRSTEKWIDTGTQLDNRSTSLADTLWDGTHLYVASHYVTVSTHDSLKASISNKPARLYRYSYSAVNRSYTLDTGFPAQINNNSSESLTIDKDSRGVLWATWTQVSGSSTTGFTSAVYVNSTTGGDSSWGTPAVIPLAGANPHPDDISAVVAYGKSKIGVMWSNQLADTVYWGVHNDGDPTGSWHGSEAVRGPHLADDHMSLKTVDADSSGRVFAAVKTSLDEVSSSTSTNPQINLLVFRPSTGSWSTSTFGTVADCHTRPVVMLDTTNSLVHVFATAPSSGGCPFSGSPGTIYEKTAPMDNPVFPSGRGTPVIRDAASANMNNVTSTKQSVNASTGLVVLASNEATSRYWHADLALASTVKPTASFTASATSGTAPLTVQFTDTSTGSPTSWSWDFGNGTTSSAQNPSMSYSSAGAYTVTLTASNAAGTSAPATTTITVSNPVVSGIVRESVSSSVATTASNGLTISQPAGTASGDVLVSCLALNGSSIPASGVPSGWSLISSVTSSSNPRIYGYYKIATAAEPTAYHWAFTSSVTSGGGIARYSGASGLDGPASKAAGASATSGTVPGVTTTTANAMVVGCMGVNSSATTLTISSPVGMTEAWDVGGKRHELADGLQSLGGPTGDKTWTFSAGREWAGWLVALRPR